MHKIKNKKITTEMATFHWTYRKRQFQETEIGALILFI